MVTQGILLLAGLATAPFHEQVDLFVVAVIGGVTLPVLFYRPTKSLWLMIYYAFVPSDLPANGGTQEKNEREPLV